MWRAGFGTWAGGGLPHDLLLDLAVLLFKAAVSPSPLSPIAAPPSDGPQAACAKLWCVVLIGVPAASRGFRGLPESSGGAPCILKHSKHIVTQPPAAPRHGGRWGHDVLRFHVNQAPQEASRRPREPRLKAEALVSNVVKACEGRLRTVSCEHCLALVRGTTTRSSCGFGHFAFQSCSFPQAL